jgi:hypothetical protein
LVSLVGPGNWDFEEEGAGRGALFIWRFSPRPPDAAPDSRDTAREKEHKQDEEDAEDEQRLG